MSPEEIEALYYLKEHFESSGFNATEEQIITICNRVSGSIEAYAEKHKELRLRPLPQMSNDSMQSPKWTETPILKRQNNE